MSRRSILGSASTLSMALAVVLSYAQNSQAEEHAGQQASTAAVEQPKVKLGGSQVSESSAEIEARRKVVRRETIREEIPTVEKRIVKADINKMTARQFESLGFPKSVSEKVVKFREVNGPFKSVRELTQVQGMTADLYAKLRGQLGVGPTEQAGQAQLPSN